jgi:hypothetical protein
LSGGGLSGGEAAGGADVSASWVTMRHRTFSSGAPTEIRVRSARMPSHRKDAEVAKSLLSRISRRAPESDVLGRLLNVSAPAESFDTARCGCYDNFL